MALITSGDISSPCPMAMRHLRHPRWWHALFVTVLQPSFTPVNSRSGRSFGGSHGIFSSNWIM
ncbi:MAG TPA: hypothetical protein VKU60_14800, partial [Chloroflexota bacterium]|nr:hypothetical protein [Chloroflexota bacterium]